MNAIAMSTSDVASSSIDAQGTGPTANEESDSRMVLTLYNAEPGTLNSILEMAFRSKTKIEMETYH